jgi:hypothetical protein
MLGDVGAAEEPARAGEQDKEVPGEQSSACPPLTNGPENEPGPRSLTPAAETPSAAAREYPLARRNNWTRWSSRLTSLASALTRPREQRVGAVCRKCGKGGTFVWAHRVHCSNWTTEEKIEAMTGHYGLDAEAARETVERWEAEAEVREFRAPREA